MKVLDIGCGNQSLKKYYVNKGYKYIGFDKKKPADVIGDIHKLPFKKGEFDEVISYAVLQYSHDPEKMLKEILRVLKNGGTFHGTAAFLESYHGGYFHYTFKGLQYILKKAGFSDIKIYPSPNWDGLTAITCMNLFPGIGIKGARLLTLPVRILSAIYWKVGSIFKKNATLERKERDCAGSYTFSCVKKGG